MCEIAYRDHNYISFRLTSVDNATAILAEVHRLQMICAEYGVQPYGVRGTNNIWGVVQILSTYTLDPMLFKSVLSRLDVAMQEIKNIFVA
jgi:hypothetical protein